ncbi:MAG: hypothetical protein SF028_15435 [Candidatus Sumerlaeia bacterium]|nr:hypothetical protein [Candidatus Sumerlaeia bacterium]
MKQHGLRATAPLAGLFALALAAAVPAQESEWELEQRTMREAAAQEQRQPAAGASAAPATEASVEELQRLLNLPRGARLGSELDEDPSNPRDIFQDAAMRQRALGERPRFIYFPEGPDPMIIPWVRAQIIAQELLDRARALEQLGDLPAAEATLVEIVDKYPTTPSATPARTSLAAVRAKIAAGANAGTETAETGPSIEPPPETQVVLPDEVRNNSFAVYFRGERNQVLVFDDILVEGDRVPRFAGVIVKRIEPGKIVYEYQGEEFEVEVDGSL